MNSIHLGNTRITYTPMFEDNDEPGKVYTTINNVMDYYPYGKILREYRSGDEERYLTTQHERDIESGLDYRGARYYDSEVSRFLSIDPMQVDRLSFNPYNYVSGNPISRIDPTGMIDDPVFGSNGEYRGETKEGYTGDIIIYDGDEKFNNLSKDELLNKDGAHNF